MQLQVSRFSIKLERSLNVASTKLLTILTFFLPEQYSCLIPVMKALLEKSEEALSLTATVPDLPSLTNSPVFFQEFQTFCTAKSWKKFIAKKVSKSLTFVFKLLNRRPATP